MCFPPDTVSSPKCSTIASIVLVFMCPATCGTFLLSTQKYTVHCLSYMVLFDIHLSYGLTANPCDFIVFSYRSYHNSADFIRPFNALSGIKYSSFTPFTFCTFSLCSGFTLQMMSTNSPLIFNMILFSYSVSALRYAPGTSKMTTSPPSCASIIILVNRGFKDMASDDASSLGM